MYITAIATPRNGADRKLLSEQHKLRAEAFSGRPGWEVNVHSGYERIISTIFSQHTSSPRQEKIMYTEGHYWQEVGLQIG